MIDIEVIDNYRYGVIEENSRAWHLLKAMNSAMILKRLSSADGAFPKLNQEEFRRACRNAQITATDHDLRVLEAFHIIQTKYDMVYGENGYKPVYEFTVTDVGQKAMADIKSGESEILVPL